MSKIVSWRSAWETLKMIYGPEFRLCLESEQRIAAAQEIGSTIGVDAPPGVLWYLNRDASISRGDWRYYEVRMVDRGGHFAPVIIEEPKLRFQGDEEAMGVERVVGRIKVEVNANGLVMTHPIDGLNGKDIGFPISVPGTFEARPEQKPVGYFYVDNMRINGTIAVYMSVSTFDYHEHGAMSVIEFKRRSRDGRSLAAIAILEGAGKL